MELECLIIAILFVLGRRMAEVGIAVVDGGMGWQGRECGVWGQFRASGDGCGVLREVEVGDEVVVGL